MLPPCHTRRQRPRGRASGGRLCRRDMLKPRARTLASRWHSDTPRSRASTTPSATARTLRTTSRTTSRRGCGTKGAARLLSAHALRGDRPRLRRTGVGELDHDLTRQHDGEPLGERIIVTGRVLDEDGRPVPGDARRDLAGQRRRPLRHAVDTHAAPLDPNFSGAGAASPTTRAATGSSRSSPARIRGGTTPTPGGRPTSISRSSAAPSRRVSSPRCTFRTTRCSTFDPIFHSMRDEKARERLVQLVRSRADEPAWALGYRFDIVLRGRDSTPLRSRS